MIIDKLISYIVVVILYNNVMVEVEYIKIED